MHGSVPDLLLVRGAPGVGKSTAVARARRHIANGAVIEVDALRGMIAGVEWTNKKQHELALDHARLLANSFRARKFRPIVIVDTLGRARLEAFLPTLEAPYRIVSLFARPDVLAARVAARPDGQFKDLSACLVLNAEMERHRYPNERLLDTTTMTPDEVSRSLLDEVSGSVT